MATDGLDRKIKKVQSLVKSWPGWMKAVAPQIQTTAPPKAKQEQAEGSVKKPD